MKAYQPRASASSTVTRYALMHLAEACAAASILFGKIDRHVTDDRLLMLVILFNTLAIGARGLVALVADRVTYKHTGVRLGVLLFALGFLWPVEFGIDAKVILTALGSAVFHGFSTSSVLERSAFRAADIGFLAAGAALGTGLGCYGAFYGYPGLALLMILACPSDRGETLPQAALMRHKKAPKTPLTPLMLPLLLLCVTALSYLVSTCDPAVGSGRKALLLLTVATALGRALGGVIADGLGGPVTLAASLGGGTALLLFCADSRALSLTGMALLALSAAPMITLVFRYLPCHPGFAASLAAGAGYLGTVIAKYLPPPEGVLPLFAGLVLLFSVLAEWVLYQYRTDDGEVKVHA